MFIVLHRQLAKYKRVTARLKEVLEDTKQQLTEREQQFKALEARHNVVAPAGLWRVIEAEEAAGVPGCRVCDVLCRVNPDAIAQANSSTSMSGAASASTPSSGASWCFVSGSDATGVKWRGWVTESELLKHAPDVALPQSLSLSRDTADQVRCLWRNETACPLHDRATSLCLHRALQKAALQVAQAGLAAVQEEYRKYRIRSETMLRQKDSEIESLTSRLLAFGSGSGSGSVGDGSVGVGKDAADGKAAARIKAGWQEQVRGMSHSAGLLLAACALSQQRDGPLWHSLGNVVNVRCAALSSQELRLKEDVTNLQAEVAALKQENVTLRQQQQQQQVSGQPAAGSVAAPAASEKTATIAGDASERTGATGGGGGSDGGDAAAATAALRELDRLKGEYATYRKRAMEMLKEKEDQVPARCVVSLQACLCARCLGLDSGVVLPLLAVAKVLGADPYADVHDVKHDAKLAIGTAASHAATSSSYAPHEQPCQCG